VSTRTNSVCKEPELAGVIESSVPMTLGVATVTDARSCVGLVNTRKNSVYKELVPVGAIEKRAADDRCGELTFD
jgi:hypothetical protein